MYSKILETVKVTFANHQSCGEITLVNESFLLRLQSDSNSDIELICEECDAIFLTVKALNS